MARGDDKERWCHEWDNIPGKMSHPGYQRNERAMKDAEDRETRKHRPLLISRNGFAIGDDLRKFYRLIEKRREV
jgi:hypothetical protein